MRVDPSTRTVRADPARVKATVCEPVATVPADESTVTVALTTRRSSTEPPDPVTSTAARYDDVPLCEVTTPPDFPAPFRPDSVTWTVHPTVAVSSVASGAAVVSGSAPFDWICQAPEWTVHTRPLQAAATVAARPARVALFDP